MEHSVPLMPTTNPKPQAINYDLCIIHYLTIMCTSIPWSFAHIYHAKAPVGYLTARQLHTYHNCQTGRIRLKRLHKHTKYTFSLFLGLTSDKSTVLCYLHTASFLLRIMAAYHTSPCSLSPHPPCRAVRYPSPFSCVY